MNYRTVIELAQYKERLKAVDRLALSASYGKPNTLLVLPGIASGKIWTVWMPTLRLTPLP